MEDECSVFTVGTMALLDSINIMVLGNKVNIL